MSRASYLLVILSAPAAYLVWRFIGFRFIDAVLDRLADRRLGPLEPYDPRESLGYEDPYEWERVA